MRFLFFCIVWALDSKLERAKMKKTMQKMAVGLVVILALSGYANEKQKFQPDSYYENKSVQELESLCENNDFKACHRAGVDHTDRTQSVKLFEKSCNGGYGKGCANLGLNYEYGSNVGQNTQKAIELYNKAIELGENMGYYWLGYLYIKGRLIQQDYVKAFEYFQKGCEQEDDNSCFEMGYAYYEGNGVKQDFTKAKKFYGKACDLGHQTSCDEYKKLQQKGY